MRVYAFPAARASLLRLKARQRLSHCKRSGEARFKTGVVHDASGDRLSEEFAYTQRRIGRGPPDPSYVRRFRATSLEFDEDDICVCRTSVLAYMRFMRRHQVYPYISVISASRTSKRGPRYAAELFAFLLAEIVVRAPRRTSSAARSHALATLTSTAYHSRMRHCLKARVLIAVGWILFGSLSSFLEAGPAIGAGTATVGGIPIYQPSTVSSRSDDTSVLFHTSRSIGNVNAYYLKFLANAGWAVLGHTATSSGASITAKRSNQGVTLSIYPAYGGTSVTLHRYPWNKH